MWKVNNNYVGSKDISQTQKFKVFIRLKKFLLKEELWYVVNECWILTRNYVLFFRHLHFCVSNVFQNP